MNEDDEETFILLVLSDSNLPTGSFVASSGLESYFKHGFTSLFPSSEHALVSFIRQSLATYARSALPFVTDAHRIVSAAKSSHTALDRLLALDKLYEASNLNHVARRASTTQGVALLTLFSKGLSKPPIHADIFKNATSTNQPLPSSLLSTLVDEFKLLVRREETSGHLPVCWGILTAAIGLSLERAQYLHLFLHARGLLSASIRLNDIGPYRSQQLLLHIVRPLVAAEATRCARFRTGLLDEDGVDFSVVMDGPANTWPLGEVIAARHDSQYSRVFNS